jgi:hypothetical protein
MERDYTIERPWGSTMTASPREIAMIEAANLRWQEADDMPDGVEFATVEFGGSTFKVFRNVGGDA